MIGIECLKADFSVPEACCDGDVFYIIRDRTITAVRMEDTTFRDRAIYGRFVCADGVVMDGFRLLCRENIDYGHAGVVLSNAPVKDYKEYSVYASVDDARRDIGMSVMWLSSLRVRDFGLVGSGDVCFDTTGCTRFIAEGYRIDGDLSVKKCSVNLRNARFVRDDERLICMELLNNEGGAFSFGGDVYASRDDADTFASWMRKDVKVVAFPETGKAYDVHVHFDMCVRVEGIIASSEEEAERKAKDIAAGMSLDKSAECTGVEACVV